MNVPAEGETQNTILPLNEFFHAICQHLDTPVSVLDGWFSCLHADAKIAAGPVLMPVQVTYCIGSFFVLVQLMDF